jgi:branched-chain amino acid transport system permease protein
MVVQLLLSGIAQGSLYALVALGMTALYRATTIVNFCHGEFFMLGAFAVYLLLHYCGLPYAVAALGAVALLFAVGMLVEFALMRPMKQAPHLSLAMMTVALSYLFRGAVRIVWGREVMPLPPVFAFAPFEIGGIYLTVQDIAVSGIALALVLVLFGFFKYSRVGRVAQAASQTARGAALVGINVPAFHSAMWGVGAAMGAVAGILIAPITMLYPDMGGRFLIRAFAAMTLGGFGTWSGAVAGGVLMGVIETMAGGLISSALMDIAAFIVIILVLLVRPVGLFGERAIVRV